MVSEISCAQHDSNSVDDDDGYTWWVGWWAGRQRGNHKDKTTIFTKTKTWLKRGREIWETVTKILSLKVKTSNKRIKVKVLIVISIVVVVGLEVSSGEILSVEKQRQRLRQLTEWIRRSRKTWRRGWCGNCGRRKRKFFYRGKFSTPMETECGCVDGGSSEDFFLKFILGLSDNL